MRPSASGKTLVTLEQAELSSKASGDSQAQDAPQEVSAEASTEINVPAPDDTPEKVPAAVPSGPWNLTVSEVKEAVDEAKKEKGDECALQ